jgi:hypothetical protein
MSLNEYFKHFCSDRYRLHELEHMRVYHKYLCSCNNLGDYLKIRDEFSREVKRAKEAYKTQQRNSAILDAKRIVSYNHLCNGNRHCKRGHSSEIAETIEFVKYAQNI